jgi:hypothetical protein
MLRINMIYLLTLAIAATRFLPHPPNFACIGALGLFAGFYFAGRKAYLVPAIALLISDLASEALGVAGMGLYSPMVMLATYGAASAAVPLGRWVAKSGIGKQIAWTRLPIATLAASTMFFLVSNFGVWAGPWYPNSLGGLVACYTNAIPFYGYTLAGDLCFAAVMFGAFEVSRRRLPAATTATNTAIA